MAEKHGAHQTGEAIVVSICEDFCKSPDKPVGYMISQKLNVSMPVCSSVRGRGTPVLNMNSRVVAVTGNEAGVGGGVMSGVNIGMCRPTQDYATMVRAEGEHVIRHDTMMAMNTGGPDGPGNVLGKIKYLKKSEAGEESRNEHGGKHYSSEEVLEILEDIEDKNLWGSFLDHAGGGKYDFKINEPTATFDVFGTTMTPGEFGNFLAGFAGQINGGAVGSLAVGIGGVAYDAGDSVGYTIGEFFGMAPPLPPGDAPPKFDWDADSRPAINAGVCYAETKDEDCAKMASGPAGGSSGANLKGEKISCPDEVDGVTQLYVGGPCGTIGLQ